VVNYKPFKFQNLHPKNHITRNLMNRVKGRKNPQATANTKAHHRPVNRYPPLNPPTKLTDIKVTTTPQPYHFLVTMTKRKKNRRRRAQRKEGAALSRNYSPKIKRQRN
jgi:hypothetical protein